MELEDGGIILLEEVRGVSGMTWGPSTDWDEVTLWILEISRGEFQGKETI